MSGQAAARGRSPWTRALVGAPAALVCALAGGACTASPPAPRDQIRFAHGAHLVAGVQCTKCHAVLAEPARTQMALPAEALCKGCHHEGAQAQCRYCHTRPDAAATYSPRVGHIVYDHTVHAAEGLDSCVDCHGLGADQTSAAAFQPELPPMARCTDSCHADAMKQLECSLCHRELHRYGRDALELVRHDPGFLHEHGARAKSDDGLCAQCHEPSFCSDCHTPLPGLPMELLHGSEIGRELIHGADFRARHATEARLDQASCMRCHGVSFCDECHRDSGIGGSVGGLSPHPPGWLDALSPRGHAREARRNILACAACHDSDAERTCVPCHRVGSLARNPHPPGFGTGLDAQTQGVCRVCHAESL